MLILAAKIIVGSILAYASVSLAILGIITTFPGMRELLVIYLLSGKSED